MAVWDEVKVVLARLRHEQREALQEYPDPTSDDCRPPIGIVLAPWAVAIAEDLNRRFGDDVHLTVGALTYPQGELRFGLAARPPAELLDPRQATVELDAPAVVRSGHTAWAGLRVHNHTGQGLEVATNGHVTAEVVDPATGEVVGRSVGAERMPLIVFEVTPGRTERIPLLIGTAGLRPEIGYAVPAGTWGLQATLELGPTPPEASRRRTPVLPLTITS